MIEIKFNREKVSGKGEDSDPILLRNESTFVVGVFDGMGGSGATTCNSAYGECTQAYVASRIIRNTVEELFQATHNILAQDIEEKCRQRLKAEIEKFPSAKSMLRNGMIREYPTTLSVIQAYSDDSDVVINSFWAGDSRNYLWTKEGLFQISKDDLRIDLDPLENLREDAPLSNCICNDRKFIINHKPIKIEKQSCAIFSATDGCFGYYKSPMHFNNMLKETLRNAIDLEDWERKVEDEIGKVAGDDASLSLIVINNDNFDNFRENILNCSPNDNFQSIREIENEISSLHNQKLEIAAQIQIAENKETEQINIEWEKYKRSYYRYFSTVLETNCKKNDNVDNNPPIEKKGRFYNCSNAIKKWRKKKKQRGNKKHKR